MGCLVQSDGWSHGGFDVEGPDVLPVLLEKWDEEVNGQVDVENQLVVTHGNVADGDVQTQDLE